MQRSLELARLGAGYVAPNPMVGALLLHEDRIIAEGWHQQYGGPHAEVNCIASVKEKDKELISQSTLYVSLEPCAHHGKTPPCTDLIIQHKIKKVVIGCQDPFKEVNGKGIEKLKVAGVEVELVDRLLAYECKNINKRFFIFHTKQRPYIILKWAQTADGKMAASPNPSQDGASLNPPEGGTSESLILEKLFEFDDSKTPPAEGLGEASRLLISNEYSNRLVHKWRSEEASILIGTNTALLDNPELTTRLWPGPSPVRLVVDMNLKLPSSLKIFNQQVRTIIFNTVKHEEDGNLLYYEVKNNVSLIHQIINALYQLNIQSVVVEGGAKLLQSFMDDGLWDEVRTVTSLKLRIASGLNAPLLSNAIKVEEHKVSTDKIEIYKPKDSD